MPVLFRRFLFALCLAVASAPAAEFVQAVEFPYSAYPRHLWERELVWLKNIGISTVAIDIPAQPAAGDPRADLPGLLKLLRRLGLRAWLRHLPPALAADLMPHTEKHGGPIAFAEGGGLDVPPAPVPVATISAKDSAALVRSRHALARARGSLLWTDVEDTLGSSYRAGVISFSGDERAGGSVLRRDAVLLRRWAAILPALRTTRPLAGPPPATLATAGPRGPSALSVVNPGKLPLAGSLRLTDPVTHRLLVFGPLSLPPGGALWLPFNVPLSTGGLCEDCAALPPQDRIVSATVEVQSVEFENGVLGFEIAATQAGEIVLQLTTRPSGPYLAAGKLTEFDWDAVVSQVKLRVPAGQAPFYRVRVGLALEPPESSGFFNDRPRLILGQANRFVTSFSSKELAARSRLLAPASFKVKAEPKSDLEIDYEVSIPADALHGEYVPLTIEADGVHLGHARVQVQRPVSLRVREGAGVHFGPSNELPPTVPLVSLDAKAGRTLRIVVRNNVPAIQNYVLTAEGEDVTFLPPKIDVSVGAAAEREVTMRVLANGSATGPRSARLRLAGPASAEQPLQLLLLRRGESLCYSADLDGDGRPEWILENPQVRATFSGADGRWLEFLWKDTSTNLLPEEGLFPLAAQPQADCVDGALAIGNRRIRLSSALEIEGPLPAALPPPASRDGIAFQSERKSEKAFFSLERANPR